MRVLPMNSQRRDQQRPDSPNHLSWKIITLLTVSLCCTVQQNHLEGCNIMNVPCIRAYPVKNTVFIEVRGVREDLSGALHFLHEDKCIPIKVEPLLGNLCNETTQILTDPFFTTPMRKLFPNSTWPRH